jgi:uncharacterized protein YlxW (UPF0749 family)
VTGRPSAEAAQRPRVDASEALLRRLLDEPIDPGYADAAARRPAAAGAPPSHPGWRFAVGLLVIGLLLVTAAGATRARGAASVKTREAVVAQIEARSRTADERARGIERLRAEIAGLRREALSSSASGAVAAQELTRLEASSGAAPVHGPGIVVTVDDAPDAPPGPGGPRQDSAPEDGRVIDRDLQVVVNGLWAAGAEAVSVNDQRLSALSAIRSAGQAILVDYRPLAPPYVVRAIGDPAALRTSFLAGPAGRWLRVLGENFAVPYDVRAEQDLRLPGASVTLRTATPVSGAPS